MAILIVLLILSVVYIVFLQVQYVWLEKRFFEMKDNYLNLTIGKKLFSIKEFIRSDEKVFYKKLTESLGNAYVIVPQVHLSDLAEVKTGYRDHDNLYHELQRVIFDYVVFDDFFRPLLLIELDGLSHFLKNRINRDAIVENLAKNIDLKIVHVKKGEKFEKTIREKVVPLLKERE